MTWIPRGEIDDQSKRWLELLERMESGEDLPNLQEFKEDDTDGRITGEHSCYLCGSHYNDKTAAFKCCREPWEEGAFDDEDD